MTAPVLRDDERAFVHARTAEQDREVARATLRLGVAFNVVLMITAYFLAPDAYFPYILTAAVICLTADVMWLLFGRDDRLVRANFVVVTFNLVLIAAAGYCLATALDAGELSIIIKIVSAIMALTPILIILSPFSGLGTPFMGATFWAIMAVLLPHSVFAAQWLAIYAVTIAFASAVRWRNSASMRTRSLLEYRALQAELLASEAKLARDFELAREIQDSMAPETRSQTPEGVSVLCLQQTFEMVGGDWMTVRRWADGTFVMVLADATGKGMQAALIVHAIQSLWATAMDDETFAPEAWLSRLNRALVRLGEKQSHSATVGIATLKGDQLGYWSAGHLPLYLLLGEREMTYKTLNSRGNVLGLGFDLQMTVQTATVPVGTPLRALLCSDGVLNGSLTARAEVLRLYEGITSEGANYLERLATADDKTLIMIERDVVSRVALPRPA